MAWYLWLVVIWVTFDVGFAAGLVWASWARRANAALRESAVVRSTRLSHDAGVFLHVSRN
jgi:hypothetical protein